MDGRLYFVIEFLHVKPGKGNTIMRVKFKDVVDGRVLERRFNIGEKLEDVRVERRPYQFLYKEGEDYIFMNNETYEQVPIAHDLITGVEYLKERGLTVFLTSHFMDEVEALCDEICILKKGTPVFRGTVEQAKAQCGCERFEDAYLQLSDEGADV